MDGRARPQASDTTTWRLLAHPNRSIDRSIDLLTTLGCRVIPFLDCIHHMLHIPTCSAPRAGPSRPTTTPRRRSPPQASSRGLPGFGSGVGIGVGGQFDIKACCVDVWTRLGHRPIRLFIANFARPLPTTALIDQRPTAAAAGHISIHAKPHRPQRRAGPRTIS